MAMGTRQKRARQEDLWVASSEIVGTPAHAFYDRLNEILDQHHFDRNVGELENWGELEGGKGGGRGGGKGTDAFDPNLE